MDVQGTERLAQLAISPSGFVFDPRTGATYTCNPTGRAVVAGLVEGEGLEGLVARLAAAFDAKDEDLGRDILEYVRLLREHGLLPPGFELGA